MQNHHLHNGFKGSKAPICSDLPVRQERIAKLETEVQSLKQKLGEAAVSGTAMVSEESHVDPGTSKWDVPTGI